MQKIKSRIWTNKVINYLSFVTLKLSFLFFAQLLEFSQIFCISCDFQLHGWNVCKWNNEIRILIKFSCIPIFNSSISFSFCSRFSSIFSSSSFNSRALKLTKNVKLLKLKCFFLITSWVRWSHFRIVVSNFPLVSCIPIRELGFDFSWIPNLSYIRSFSWDSQILFSISIWATWCQRLSEILLKKIKFSNKFLQIPNLPVSENFPVRQFSSRQLSTFLAGLSWVLTDRVAFSIVHLSSFALCLVFASIPGKRKKFQSNFLVKVFNIKYLNLLLKFSNAALCQSASTFVGISWIIKRFKRCIQTSLLWRKISFIARNPKRSLTKMLTPNSIIRFSQVTKLSDSIINSPLSPPSWTPFLISSKIVLITWMVSGWSPLSQPYSGKLSSNWILFGACWANSLHSLYDFCKFLLVASHFSFSASNFFFASPNFRTISCSGFFKYLGMNPGSWHRLGFFNDTLLVDGRSTTDDLDLISFLLGIRIWSGALGFFKYDGKLPNLCGKLGVDDTGKDWLENAEAGR